MATTKATIADVLDELHRTGRATVIGFGTFRLTERQPRRGRNPKTGEAIDIAGYRTVAFSPSATLRGQLNQPAQSEPQRMTGGRR